MGNPRGTPSLVWCPDQRTKCCAVLRRAMTLKTKITPELDAKGELDDITLTEYLYKFVRLENAGKGQDLTKLLIYVTSFFN